MRFPTVFPAAAAIGLFCLFGPQTAHAQSVSITSKLGGKCMDAERGVAHGAKLIGYPCNPGASNQTFNFNANGTITVGGYCLDAAGGHGRSGDNVILWACNGGRNQKWAMNYNGTITGINGKCLDLQYGDNPVYWALRTVFAQNQAIILWECNGQKNQQWLKAKAVPSSNVIARGAVAPGQLSTIMPSAITADQMDRAIRNGTKFPVNDPASVIAAGGGNVIAAGGGNILVALSN